MERTIHKRIEKPPSGNISVLLTFLLLATTSLAGCEDEHDRAWREWREEAGKVDYRCGMFADYEFKVNRAYLFFWPTYKGRNDWEVQGPPPLSCSAKLETISMEAYWPGLTPAGKTAEEFSNPDRIHINLNSVGKLDKWDLVLHLEYTFGKNKWKNTPSYERNMNNLTLDYAEAPSGVFPDVMVENYWTEEADGNISTFIKCYAVNPAEEPSCTQDQYIPEMQAVLIIKYKKSKLKYWKLIRKDAISFVAKHSQLKGFEHARDTKPRES